MRAEVNPDTCIGCEACVVLCPEVFEMKIAIAVAKTNPVPTDAQAVCKDAMNICPTKAISIK